MSANTPAICASHLLDARDLLRVHVRLDIMPLRGKQQREHSVGTRGPVERSSGAKAYRKLHARLVHVRRGDCSGLVTLVHEGHHLVEVAND